MFVTHCLVLCISYMYLYLCLKYGCTVYVWVHSRHLMGLLLARPAEACSFSGALGICHMQGVMLCVAWHMLEGPNCTALQGQWLTPLRVVSQVTAHSGSLLRDDGSPHPLGQPALPCATIDPTSCIVLPNMLLYLCRTSFRHAAARPTLCGATCAEHACAARPPVAASWQQLV